MSKRDFMVELLDDPLDCLFHEPLFTHAEANKHDWEKETVQSFKELYEGMAQKAENHEEAQDMKDIVESALKEMLAIANAPPLFEAQHDPLLF